MNIAQKRPRVKSLKSGTYPRYSKTRAAKKPFSLYNSTIRRIGKKLLGGAGASGVPVKGDDDSNIAVAVPIDQTSPVFANAWSTISKFEADSVAPTESVQSVEGTGVPSSLQVNMSAVFDELVARIVNGVSANMSGQPGNAQGDFLAGQTSASFNTPVSLQGFAPKKSF